MFAQSELDSVLIYQALVADFTLMEAVEEDLTVECRDILLIQDGVSQKVLSQVKFTDIKMSLSDSSKGCPFMKIILDKKCRNTYRVDVTWQKSSGTAGSCTTLYTTSIKYKIKIKGLNPKLRLKSLNKTRSVAMFM